MNGIGLGTTKMTGTMDGKSSTLAKAGGRDEKKRQIQDQSWSNDSNSSLEMSVINGLPVRVIRKHLKGSKWGPPTPGYRYDGLYKAIRVRNIIGEAGYKMCQVLLERLPGQEHLPWTTSEPDYTKVNRDGDGWVLAIAEADKVPSKPTQIQTSLRVDETRSAEPPQASPIQSDSTSTLPESMTQSQIARGKSKLPPISFHKNKN
ncbi:sra-ydg domain protein [Moniliophthora roreri]|uniref:YDG domain-containing protein n=1 Tax=Moniliophthora roreri TaxID=221103 RepID=A0A0W0FDS9_MONRR|nr:sra-ydg domain protein [Moniliophthora roreri]